MNLVLTWLSTRRHRESSFHHCGGPVKLVEAWLCARRHLETSFHHCCGSVKLGKPIYVPGKIERAVFTTVVVLSSSRRHV